MRRVLLCLSVCFFSVFACADTAIDNLQAKLEGITSFSANFTQQVLSNNGAVLQSSSGVVKIRKPGHFLWDVEKPMQQLSVSDGQKVWMYSPDLEQVTIQNVDPNLAKTPVLLLSGKQVNLAQNFSVTQAQSDGITWFTLVPNGDNPLFKKLSLGFSSDDLTTMRLLNNLNQTTLIHFADQKTNNDVPLSAFKLHWSSDTNVVDMTQ